MQPKQYSLLSLPVIVGALGFFVDIYGLLLFNIVRIESFKDLGVTPDQMKEKCESVIIWQMPGLVIGGLIWGVLGDKKERKSVLFGSILLLPARVSFPLRPTYLNLPTRVSPRTFWIYDLALKDDESPAEIP